MFDATQVGRDQYIYQACSRYLLLIIKAWPIERLEASKCLHLTNPNHLINHRLIFSPEIISHSFALFNVETFLLDSGSISWIHEMYKAIKFGQIQFLGAT